MMPNPPRPGAPAAKPGPSRPGVAVRRIGTAALGPETSSIGLKPAFWHSVPPAMQPTDPSPTPPLTPAPTAVIPVIAETARIGKEVVETGRVVIRKTVHHDTQTVAVPTQEEQVQVERIAINRVVDTPPDVRHEGDLMIIPVLREEVVVTTRLVLVEELHVHKRTLTLTHPQEVSLRREEVHYERLAPEGPPEAPPPA